MDLILVDGQTHKVKPVYPPSTLLSGGIQNIVCEMVASRDLNPHPLDYVPNALTTGLWECDTFQFMVWDTGCGDIDILFVKVDI